LLNRFEDGVKPIITHFGVVSVTSMNRYQNTNKWKAAEKLGFFNCACDGSIDFTGDGNFPNAQKFSILVDPEIQSSAIFPFVHSGGGKYLAEKFLI
jgi:hypothetical protein